MCAEENLLFDKTPYIFWVTEPSIYFFNVFKITLYNNNRTMQFWVAITESGKILLHRNIYFSTVNHFYIRNYIDNRSLNVFDLQFRSDGLNEVKYKVQN